MRRPTCVHVDRCSSSWNANYVASNVRRCLRQVPRMRSRVGGVSRASFSSTLLAQSNKMQATK